MMHAAVRMGELGWVRGGVASAAVRCMMMIPYGSARMGLIRTSVPLPECPSTQEIAQGQLEDEGGSFPHETPVTRSLASTRALVGMTASQ